MVSTTLTHTDHRAGARGPTVSAHAYGRNSTGWMPDVSSKLVYRHRFARATAARSSHPESELGRDAARRLVLALADVGRDAADVGSAPEIVDRDAHRLCRDPLV